MVEEIEFLKMITLTEIKRELVEEKEKYFKNYLYWGKKIKEIAKKNYSGKMRGF